jgi:hypothetical protein
VYFSEPTARARFRAGADFTGSATLSTADAILNYEYGATLGPGRAINLEHGAAILGVGGNATFTVAPGATLRGRGRVASNLFFSGAGTLVNDGTVVADVSGGTLTLNPDAVLNGSGVLRATNGGKLILPSLTGNLNGSAADGTDSLIRIGSGTYTINEPLSVTGGAVLHLKGSWTTAANIDACGKIIFDYTDASPFGVIRAEVISGHNGGLWNGGGINSSAAASTPGTGVGYAEASDVLAPTGGMFAGEFVDGTAVLVRFTRYGDANLDGVVNLSDFNRLAANFGTTGTVWARGDFNYDDLVNLSDFNRLAANFGLSAGSDGVVDPADWAVLAAAVPEPAISTLIGGLCLTTLLRHRRSRLRHQAVFRLGVTVRTV